MCIAGQTGVGADGAVVGADLASQTAQALRNVGTAVEAAGATWDDVAKMTILIVGYEPSMADALSAASGRCWRRDAQCGDDVHGVHSLFEPEFLVEIEAIAEL